MNWQVVFYMDTEGNEPVKDFILKQPNGAIAEIVHVFKLLREFNITLGMPYVRKIDKSGLRELRIRHSSDLYRIFYFAYIGKKFVLLHAILKKEAKTPESDKELAIKRMNDYRARY
ncbi:MAG: type II toxin-antitoxin system RelE/ParE family toxin [Dehalococcoidales bacterium]|nr:type II toxin-antitoxin system RelE/ParE family toxin [Dehalococcoidales bacterium]